MKKPKALDIMISPHNSSMRSIKMSIKLRITQMSVIRDRTANGCLPANVRHFSIIIPLACFFNISSLFRMVFFGKKSGIVFYI
ncbi:MAG: hypothetical protein ACFFHV_07315 [Promethearchaeota archaeon]